MGAALPFLRLSPWVLLLVLPAVAFAAAQATLSIDAEAPRFWVALAVVQLVGFFGWSVSSLPDLAQWKDHSGGDVAIAERRLKILQGILMSLFAANLAYYGGYYYSGLAELPSFLAAGLAAFGGDKFVLPLLTRATAALSVIFGGAAKS
jgi:hypothetical protein